MPRVTNLGFYVDSQLCSWTREAQFGPANPSIPPRLVYSFVYIYIRELAEIEIEFVIFSYSNRNFVGEVFLSL